MSAWVTRKLDSRANARVHLQPKEIERAERAHNYMAVRCNPLLCRVSRPALSNKKWTHRLLQFFFDFRCARPTWNLSEHRVWH